MFILRLVFTHLLVFCLGLGIGSFYTSYQNVPLPTSQTSSLLPQPSSQTTSSGSIAGTEREKATVQRVVDGDTIVLSDGRTLRYIGIDTPETVDPNRPTGCFGKEASLKNRELVFGKEIEMEKDISEMDRFKRLLRYVYTKNEEGALIMVNEQLVKDGFAQSISYPPDVKYQEVFRAAETLARTENRGLWGSCLLQSPSPKP